MVAVAAATEATVSAKSVGAEERAAVDYARRWGRERLVECFRC